MTGRSETKMLKRLLDESECSLMNHDHIISGCVCVCLIEISIFTNFFIELIPDGFDGFFSIRTESRGHAVIEREAHLVAMRAADALKKSPLFQTFSDTDTKRHRQTDRQAYTHTHRHTYFKSR